MPEIVTNAAVCREESGKLRITIEKSGTTPLDLYWTSGPGPETRKKTLVQKNAPESLLLDDPLPGRRVYFLLDGADGAKPFVFAERCLKVPGLNNFRDYGGYRTMDGRRVKWGLLYRSDHLSSIPPQTADYIRSLGIAAIIDYRSADEIRRRPNKDIGERRTFNFDPSAHTAELAAQFAASPDNENQALIDKVLASVPKEKINGQGEQVLDQYRNFVNSEKAKKAFHDMLAVMLDRNNAPSIQHCRGGKDRTGYGVLLVLTMLGVSKDDIIQDYMITQKNRTARNSEKMDQYRQLTGDRNVLDYLFSLIDTREYFIEEAFRAMEKKAGSAEQYIRQELNFTDQDFRRMQKNYLQDN
jgi:protein-tyrosine phosphatase